MIKEINNLIANIDEKYFIENLVPSNGLHLWLQLDNDSKRIRENSKYYFVKKSKSKKKYFEIKDEKLFEIENLKDIPLREYYSGYLTMNKTPERKIHSVSPYVVWIKKKFLDEAKGSFKSYFNKLKEYHEEKEYSKIDIIHKFCEQQLIELIKSFKQLDELDDNAYIKTYFNQDLDKIKNGYKYYLGSCLFTKPDYNKKEGEFGLSNFLNGDNNKKLFLMHKTSRFYVNNRISREEAYNLYLFGKLLTNKPNSKLPNPLPIFIEQDELNKEVIELYNREGKHSFHEVISSLFETRRVDLLNYYLIFWSRNLGLSIKDQDYVPKFKYFLKNFIIKNVMGVLDKEKRLIQDEEIKNIFQLERIFDSKIFYQIQKSTGYRFGALMNNYFSNVITPPKGYEIRHITKLNLLRFRKLIYDYIYKSKSELITQYIFNKLLLSTIIDNIKTDEKRSNEFKIKELINIQLSLNKNFGGEDMASKIPELRDKLYTLLNNENQHISSDEEFAFNAGQLVYYLIYQSETSNKTHALLEPYISKSDPNLFKLAITRGIEKYKHNFPFGTKKFQKLTSEILGYDCNKIIKDMLPILLAGYFSNSMLLDKQ